jgi:carbonic anhydrase/acetyltransferase-like protein (isoleucine patch superfamily)
MLCSGPPSAALSFAARSRYGEPVLIALNGVTPEVHPTAYVHSSAQVIGDVHIGEESSLWFNVVARGDVYHIRIGARTNIQDNSTLHVTAGQWPTIIGDEVTVGHGVILHGCTVGNRCLIGIGAVVLDRCRIGEDCMVGAGALLTPGTVVEPGHLMLGSPARAARRLRPEELDQLRQSAEDYVENARRYRSQGIL